MRDDLQGDREPRVVLAAPRGFCAGVRRAIRIVERALDEGGPVFVRHEIVHNRSVVEGLRARGAIFVEELTGIPAGAVTILSAHGVSAAVGREAAVRELDVIDATCPLVKKVHREVAAHAAQGRHVVLIGHAGHPEIVGTMGQLPPGAITLVEGPDDLDAIPAAAAPSLAFAMQTTLSVDEAAATVAALEARFPGIVGPEHEDICYATTNRQSAVKALARICEVILVVGSANSSNSRRLCETAERAGARAQLIDDASAIDWAALAGVCRVGITAGASAPETSVQQVARLVAARIGAREITELDGPEEPDIFALPSRFRRQGGGQAEVQRTTSRV